MEVSRGGEQLTGDGDIRSFRAQRPGDELGFYSKWDGKQLEGVQ